MTYPINVNIPAAANDPADDQPEMQTNFSNINSYVQVDHTNPAATGAGQHKQVTFNANNVPSAPINPVSVLYTNAGTASANSQLFWKNADSAFHISPIRAWGVVDAAGNIIASQSVNVASVVQNGTGKYTITLTAGAVSSTNFGVLVSGTISNSFSGALTGYSIVGANTFQVNMVGVNSGSGINRSFTFMVLQI